MYSVEYLYRPTVDSEFHPWRWLFTLEYDTTLLENSLRGVKHDAIECDARIAEYLCGLMMYVYRISEYNCFYEQGHDFWVLGFCPYWEFRSIQTQLFSAKLDISRLLCIIKIVIKNENTWWPLYVYRNTKIAFEKFIIRIKRPKVCMHIFSTLVKVIFYPALSSWFIQFEE